MKYFKVVTYALLTAIMLNLIACQEKPTAKISTLSNTQQVKDCSFSQTGNWWSKPYSSLPGSIAINPVTGEPEFCEFYQFAEAWFLYLISPSSKPGMANWENQQRFPLLETAGTNSCDDAYPTHALNVRTAKRSDDKQPYVLPERIDQAGRQHAIYDQHGNIIFYEIRFSKNLCDYPAIQSRPNFPGKTLEMKMAWRVLKGNTSNSDNADHYFQTSATINGKAYTLGLVGWHIVVTADNHPEMVWITLDHKNNAVSCEKMGAGQQAYDFTSQACAQNKNNCNHLNETLKSKQIKLPDTQQPYDICQAFPYGTLEDQPISTNDGLNIALIQKLNRELQTTLFTQSGLPSSLTVWKNYQFTGALWLSDITKGSDDNDNQRGSLELANTVMETSFQGTAGQKGSALNCFVCHNYNGTASSNPVNTGKNSISHIFDDIISGQQCNDVQASQLINNQAQAESTCPTTCTRKASNLAWNGQWTNQDAKTGKQLPMTVCGCCVK